MGIPLRILIVEDNPDDAKLSEYELRRGGFDVQSRLVSTAAELTEALDSTLWDIILCDHNMPTFDSAAALRIATAHQPDAPFIIVSGSLPEASAAKSMLQGAQDYLSKDNLARLVPVVKRELKDAIDRRARRKAEQALSVQTEELRIARGIQQRLFPATAPVLAGFEIAGASWPAAATGGDYFDYIPMKENRLGIIIGDVTGHGLGPALIMADARAIFRTLARTFSDVNQILSHANDLLREDIDSDRFLTVFFGRLCPTQRQFTFLNAGHPTGLLLNRDGQLISELNATLPALGMFPFESVAEPITLTLDPGHLLLLLTDGVIETTDPAGEEFGYARVVEVVRAHRTQPAANLIHTLYTSVRSFSQNQLQNDDITMVIIKAKD